MRYRADITAGSLKLIESRVIADLLMREADEQEWKSTLYDNNMLQTRNPATAKRLSRLLRARLITMDSGLWRLVRDGTSIVATHACLAVNMDLSIPKMRPAS